MAWSTSSMGPMNYRISPSAAESMALQPGQHLASLLPFRGAMEEIITSTRPFFWPFDLEAARTIPGGSAAARLQLEEQGSCASTVMENFMEGNPIGSPAASTQLEEDLVFDDGVMMMKRKRRLSRAQVRSLEASFEEDNKLEAERKQELAQTLGLQPRQVAVWFQNRRARSKTKLLERDFDLLKSQYHAMRAETHKLRAEVSRLTKELEATRGEAKLPSHEVAIVKETPASSNAHSIQKNIEEHEVSKSSKDNHVSPSSSDSNLDGPTTLTRIDLQESLKIESRFENVDNLLHLKDEAYLDNITLIPITSSNMLQQTSHRYLFADPISQDPFTYQVALESLWELAT